MEEEVIELRLIGGVTYKPKPPLKKSEVLRVFGEIDAFFLVLEATDGVHHIPKHAIVDIVTAHLS